MHPLEYVFGGEYAPSPLWLSMLLLLLLVAIILFGGERLGMGKRKHDEPQDVPIVIFSIVGVFFIIPTILGYPGIGITVAVGLLVSCSPLLIPQSKCYREQIKESLELEEYIKKHAYIADREFSWDTYNSLWEGWG